MNKSNYRELVKSIKEWMVAGKDIPTRVRENPQLSTLLVEYFTTQINLIALEMGYKWSQAEKNKK